MKASELRIGNYIEVNGEIRQVTSGIIVTIDTISKPDTKPIPLTEEWLLKFGFEDITGIDYILHIDIDFKLILIPADAFYPQIDKADDVGWSSISLNKIEYIHQLQNLYFALTGEELTIKD